MGSKPSRPGNQEVAWATIRSSVAWPGQCGSGREAAFSGLPGGEDGGRGRLSVTAWRPS